MSRLPSELLLHIIDCLIPANPPVAFPASHLVTRTLLSLCLVSRTLHSAAVRHLLAHCAYIDSPDRLRLLQQTLHNLDDDRAFGSSPSQQNSPQAIDDEHRNSSVGGETTKRPLSLTESLFLAPFPDDSDDIEDPEIASAILDLCTRLGPYLTRFVIDIRLRSLYPEDDHRHVRPTLLAAFQTPTAALEEFVSTRDELFLDIAEHEGYNKDIAVWSTWPNLRRLALYNADVSHNGFLRDILQCRSLTHLVLTRADGLTVNLAAILPFPLWQLSPHLRRVLLVNTAVAHRRRSPFSRRRWNDCFLGRIWNLQSHAAPGHEVEIVRIDVPVPAGVDEEGPTDVAIETCQEWVRDSAIQGTLWDAPGALLSVKADPEDPALVTVGWLPTGLPGADAVLDFESDSE